MILRFVAVLVAISLLGCDDTLTGLSKSVDVGVVQPELVVFEEAEAFEVSASIGVFNRGSFAIGFSRCDVVLQGDGPEGWQTVTYLVCLDSAPVWVGPGSGRAAQWTASESFAEGWVPEAGMEYRFKVFIRSPDDEQHTLSSDPFVMDPTPQ